MRGRRTQNKKKNGASETVVSTSRRLAATTRSATRQKRLSRTSMTTSHHKSLASIYADRPSVQDRLNTYSDPYVTNTHTLSLESLARAAISRTSDLSIFYTVVAISRSPSSGFFSIVAHIRRMRYCLGHQIVQHVWWKIKLRGAHGDGICR